MHWDILGFVHHSLPGQAVGTECVHKAGGEWNRLRGCLKSFQSKKAVGTVLLYNQHYKHLPNSVLWLKFFSLMCYGWVFLYETGQESIYRV